MTTGTVTRRGTTNRNQRGSAEGRRRRREWLIETYRADVDVAVSSLGGVIGEWSEDLFCAFPFTREPACRCYRCGTFLTVETVTVDRIIPGCKGGTYRRDNIRPACGHCNSSTGGALASRRAS